MQSIVAEICSDTFDIRSEMSCDGRKRMLSTVPIHGCTVFTGFSAILQLGRLEVPDRG